MGGSGETSEDRDEGRYAKGRGILDELFEGLDYLTLVGMGSCDPACDPVPAGFVYNPILKDIKMFRIYNYHRSQQHNNNIQTTNDNAKKHRVRRRKGTISPTD